MARRFDLWGVPFDGGATLGWPGARHAPDHIRRALSWMTMRIEDDRIFALDTMEVLEVTGDLLRDRGDVGVVAHDLMATIDATSQAVAEWVVGGQRPHRDTGRIPGVPLAVHDTSRRG